MKTGRTLAGRVFSGRAPVSSPRGPEVAQALDAALNRILIAVVRWAGAPRAEAVGQAGSPPKLR